MPVGIKKPLPVNISMYKRLIANRDSVLVCGYPG